MEAQISEIDYSIILIFLVGTALFGWFQSRLNKTTEDFFLAGRNIPWVVAMLSIVATETSVLTFISVPGLAYQGNWYFLQLSMGYIVGRVLVSIFLLPQYFHFPITSIYEILGRRFGTGIQKTASAVFLFTRILADGIRFLATATIVHVISGWSLPMAVYVIGGVTLFYTIMGGIRTVVWVDSFQFILYLGSGILIIIFAVHLITAPVTEIMQQLTNSGKSTIFNFHDNFITHANTFVSALIGGAFLSFASHGADYLMVQRVLGTRNISSARKAMIGSGIFVTIQFSVFLLAGSLIYVYFGGMPMEKDRELATFIMEALPVGVKGILFAGVLSAAMSTLSSSINSLASSTVSDWHIPATLKNSRFISLFWAVVLMGIALIFDEGNTAIVILGLQIASFTYGGLLGLFILSRQKARYTSGILIVGLLSSLLIVLYLKQTGLAWTWFIACAVAVNVAVVNLIHYSGRWIKK